MKTDLTITISIFTLLSIGLVLASDGDRSPFYQTCVKRCKNANCTHDDNFTPDAAKLLDFSSWLLQWSCRDECRYHCMWRTVDAFAERDYNLPKFHGKWPFARVLGVQEPASALASLLNLAGHVYMHYEMTTQLSVKSAPLLLFWHGFAVVCENAWAWSAIFHTRDTPLTEFMDYACALSMVMSLLVAAIVRVFHGRKKRGPLTLLLLLFGYYVMHARYLYSGRIDYGFNILVNVVCGVCGGLLWAVWSCIQLARGRSHAARMLVFSVWSGAALSLELLDFPPLLGWDAHALWHLATAPLPLIFYRVFHGRKKRGPLTLLLLLFGYYVMHARYLYSGRIDYGFNILVNVVCGVCGGLLWAVWSCIQLARGRSHAARMLVFSVWSGAALSLELLDFPPLLGWDAHALWHLATVPLPLIFYRFVIDDLKYLQNEKQPDKVDVKQS